MCYTTLYVRTYSLFHSLFSCNCTTQPKASSASQQFEAQTIQEEFTQAELEEITVRKRRQDGTPCTKENFEAWKARFEAEMASRQDEDKDDNNDAAAKKKTVDKSGRLTGYQQFSGIDITNNLEALEAAAENAERDEEESVGDVDEELFMDEDDVDLDDLDFESDDDGEDEDEEEQVDI